MRNEEYVKKQVDGHKDTEKYALMTYGYMKLMKWLRQKVPKKGKVLEIGCNTGYECVAIQSEKRVVTGIDLGEEFIEKALTYRFGNVHYVTMDMHNLRFPDGYFDCVYANNTLEHAHTPEKVISGMYRVTKKGGGAVICIPADYKNPDYKPTQNWDSSLHLWKPNKTEFKKALVSGGFKAAVREIDAYEMFGLENKASKNHYLVAICAK